MLLHKNFRQLYIVFGMMIALQTSYTQAVIIENLETGRTFVTNLTNNSNYSNSSTNATYIPSQSAQSMGNDPLTQCTNLLSAEEEFTTLTSAYLIISTVILGLLAIDYVADISGRLNRRLCKLSHRGINNLTAFMISILHLIPTVSCMFTSIFNHTFESRPLVAPLAQFVGACIMLGFSATKSIQYSSDADFYEGRLENIQIRNQLRINTTQELTQDITRLSAMQEQLNSQLDRKELQKKLIQQIAQAQLQLKNSPDDDCAICTDQETTELGALGIIPCISGPVHSQRIHQRCLEGHCNSDNPNNLKCPVCRTNLIGETIISQPIMSTIAPALGHN